MFINYKVNSFRIIAKKGDIYISIIIMRIQIELYRDKTSTYNTEPYKMYPDIWVGAIVAIFREKNLYLTDFAKLYYFATIEAFWTNLKRFLDLF